MFKLLCVSVADEESSGTLLPLVVILASIAVALIGVTVVVVEARKSES